MEEKKFEKSCGAIVYEKNESQVKYILVCDKSGYWGFPKGHMEDGESEYDTALREIKEETNLGVTIVDGFREEEKFNLEREGRPNTIKQTVYFLAKYENQEFRPQVNEIEKIKLIDFELAVKLLKFDSLKEMLIRANNFLERENKTE